MILPSKKIVLPKLSVDRSKIHGNGLYADAEVCSGTLICEEYLTAADNGAAVQFDGPLRWVNHSSNPNAHLLTNFNRAESTIQLRLYAGRIIEAGEEITYNYMLSGHRGEATGCTCGEPGCQGFFHLRVEFGELR